MARQTVDAALAEIGRPDRVGRKTRIIDPLTVPDCEKVDLAMLQHLCGRHGAETGQVIACAGKGELEPIERLPNPWAELRFAARSEGVVHLDDLLLRRVRLGMLLPEGGRALLPRVRAIAQSELGWSDARWEKEEKEYLKTWQFYYSPTPGK